MTVTNTTYCDMHQRGLKPAINSKRRGRLLEGVLLFHDIACPHSAAHTLENSQNNEAGSHGKSKSQSTYGAI
jgi:hypothetical protein